MINRLRTWLALGICALAMTSPTAAQITPPRKLTVTTDRIANLTEQLTNRLRAFDEEKRSYLAMVVKKVNEGKIELKLVLAVQRYAIQRNPEFPFPYFERALRFESGRRGFKLPTVRQFASTNVPPTR